MNNTLGERIAGLRKERGMTQEDLARELNVSYQAVSKWENGISSPDISNIKQLAQFFCVSIDMLFGLEPLPAREAEPPMPPAADETPGTEEAPSAPTVEACPLETHGEALSLPWEDDGTLRAVLFRGRRLISSSEIKKPLVSGITLSYNGSAENVFSYFDVGCGNVYGNVKAGGDVDCGDVYGNVTAAGDVDCGAVNGKVEAGGDVDCGDVGDSVTASGDVNCGSVGGSVF